MIPFNKAWTYEIIAKDIYVSSCPFCHTENVLLPLKIEHLKLIQTGQKKLLIFPCCFNKVTLIDADQDYLLTDTVLR
ncbi:hypothetical protein ACFSTH_15715 [Paenibacillus yanchengensis]|uniref:Uncharacterized protein n=1 Tax=Paenibacillus yanchengensis TaxID=2035833 RepID=A0ABW4YFW1_9BACL